MADENPVDAESERDSNNGPDVRPWRIIALCLVGLGLLLLITLNRPDAAGIWTRQYVESRWNKPKPRVAVGPYWLNFGWDATQRFYAAVPNESGLYTNVTLVDRIKGRWCTLGTANWTQAQFGADSYDIAVWNQYGWRASTSLNLKTWEVTITVTGSCFQWMSCRRHDPPQVTGPEYCDSAKTYGPGGLLQ